MSAAVSRATASALSLLVAWQEAAAEAHAEADKGLLTAISAAKLAERLSESLDDALVVLSEALGEDDPRCRVWWCRSWLAARGMVADSWARELAAMVTEGA